MRSTDTATWYSGDTRPVLRLIEAAQGADVLVHETGGLATDLAELEL